MKFTISYGGAPVGQFDVTRPDDTRMTLQRKAAAPLKPRAPQAPCDQGLFSDASGQLDICDVSRRLTPRE